jgi:hypothetical protein
MQMVTSYLKLEPPVSLPKRTKFTTEYCRLVPEKQCPSIRKLFIRLISMKTDMGIYAETSRENFIFVLLLNYEEHFMQRSNRKSFFIFQQKPFVKK